MVKLHVKFEEESQFWYETVTSVPIKELSANLNSIFSHRRRIKTLAAEAKQLIAGASTHGISEESAAAVGQSVAEIESRLSPEAVSAGELVQQEGIKECFDILHGALRLIHLAESVDTAATTATDTTASDTTATDTTATDTTATDTTASDTTATETTATDTTATDTTASDTAATETTTDSTHAFSEAFKQLLQQTSWSNVHQDDGEPLPLYFSSKQLAVDEVLSTYIGRNEKSKVVVRLGAPVSSGSQLVVARAVKGSDDTLKMVVTPSQLTTAVVTSGQLATEDLRQSTAVHSPPSVISTTPTRSDIGTSGQEAAGLEVETVILSRGIREIRFK